MRKVDVSLILPCFNEEKIILESLRKIIAMFEDTKFSWELICIDDGSQDSTRRILKKFSRNKKNIRVVTNQMNLGRGGSVIEGFDLAKGEVVGFIDSDLEVSPIYIPEFVREVRKGADLAIGNRRYNETFLTLHRWVMSKLYTSVVKYFFSMDISDTEAGYKFFNKKKILPVFKTIQNKRWFFDTEIVARSYWAKLKIVEIPILLIRRTDKQTSVKFLKDSLDYLTSLWRLKKEHNA